MIGSLDNAHAWAPWVLVMLAAASTYIWRAIGTSIAAKIDPDSDLFQWVACVAYGLFAGLIARIMIYPVGLLGESATVDRLGAAAFGFVLFFICKRNIFVATFGAAGAFLVIVWLRTEGFI